LGIKSDNRFKVFSKYTRENVEGNILKDKWLAKLKTVVNGNNTE